MAAASRDRLVSYRRKRDFSRTPEPRGSSGTSAGQSGAYVVQKHAARRLHFDLRLELDGVLKSWAVTRGPSLDPADKRLAVRTEDHPLEYGDFEGTIPAGQYGGGTVMLWDQGRWEPRDDPHHGLERGSLKFILHGERLRGRFALVRIRNSSGSRRTAAENWLLIKEKDEWSERNADPVRRWRRSVASGRTMDDIAGAVQRSRLRTPPSFVRPQLASIAIAPPTGDQWLHELKFDGYRALLAIGGGEHRVYTRSGLDWTGKFPSLRDTIRRLDVDEALIDGELVVLDDRGVSRFELMQRAIRRHPEDIVMMAFDLLRLNGEDLRALPLGERKRRLRELLPPADRELRYSDHQRGGGPAVLEAACRLGLEGIVSKRIDLPYHSGWIKTKCGGREEFVIVGYRPSTARGRPFSSLLLGVYDGSRLIYRGRVASGLNQQMLDELSVRFRRLARRTSPLKEVPQEVARDARWLTPRLVAEIAYTERTADGVLRHPRFLGLRFDKDPRDVCD